MLAGAFAGFILGRMVGGGTDHALSAEAGLQPDRVRERQRHDHVAPVRGHLRELAPGDHIDQLGLFGWWAVWQCTDIAEGYNDYLVLFVTLGTVGFLCFLAAGYFPVLRFTSELKRLHGGEDVRESTVRQIHLARVDLANIQNKLATDAADEEVDRLEDDRKDLGPT
jgi:hypothetical protein